MSQSPRGLLLQFPDHVPDLDALPEGTLLEPGTRVRYKGRFWRVAPTPHCADPADKSYYMVSLINAKGRRYCLRCGLLDEHAEAAS